MQRWMAAVLMAWGMAGGAAAQEPAATAHGLDLGVRYWLSSGKTQRAHDASQVVPTLGNPTSVLIYDDLWANTVELYARKRLGERWFVKGNLGIGQVNTGTFYDQDFEFMGSSLFISQTVSNVSGKLQYGTLDIGREVWKGRSVTIDVFAGYQQWNERLDGNGLSDSFGPFSLSDDVLVITNDLTWKAARLGAVMRSESGRTRYAFEVALIPYASYRNEDSHYLRSNPIGTPFGLGPVPNVIAEGHGRGAQFELDIRRSYPQYFGLDFGVGLRYWVIRADGGTQTQANLALPIVDLESERFGLMLSVGKRW